MTNSGRVHSQAQEPNEDGEGLSEAAVLSLRETVRDAVHEAVTAAIRESITHDAASRFWEAAFIALQQSARQHTGRFVLGAIAGLLERLWLFGLLAGIVYAMGGWAALVAFWKAMFGSAT